MHKPLMSCAKEKSNKGELNLLVMQVVKKETQEKVCPHNFVVVRKCICNGQNKFNT